ncbi:MAG: dihydrodipicolinate synthase family protein, partial [Proteobacteria bacterium]|nr:dihydrodipicolinate synthase family protein [Pseudomonadota bacterium]
MFTGSLVALVTPFSNGQIDYASLGNLVEFHIDNGTNGLVPCGTTGESPTISHQENKDVIKFVVEKTAGRLPVIAGTGSNCTEEAIEMTRYAKEAGASGTLQVAPYYN